MNDREKIKPFFETYNDDFDESIEEIRRYLKKNNKEYKNIYDKIHRILEQNTNIQKVIDEDIVDAGLSEGECKSLSEVIILYWDLQAIMEKEIYCKGGMDTYYYLKKIGVIQ